MPSPASQPSARADAPPLRRVRDDTLVVGVCAGIARRVGLAPIVVRLITLVVIFAIPPLALIAYTGLAVAIPRDDGRVLLAGTPKDTRETIVGWALIVLTLITVAAGIETSFVGGPGGFVLLAGGALLLLVQHQRTAAPPGAAAQSPQTSAPSSSATQAAAPRRVRHDLPYPGAPRNLSTAAVTAANGAPQSEGAPAPTLPLTAEVPPASSRAHSDEASVGVIAAGVLVGAGALAVLLNAFDVFDLSAKGLAVALGLGAVVLTVGAIAMSRRRGAIALIVFAVLMALGSLAAATAGPHIEHGIGDRVEYPVTGADLSKQYRFGIGSYTLDLTGAELPPGATTVHARLGIGELVVRVPAGVRVDSVGRTGVGGVGLANARAGATDRTILVDAHVEHGSAEVEVASRFVP